MPVNKSTVTDKQLLPVILLADRALAVVSRWRLIFVSDNRIGYGRNQCASELSWSTTQIMSSSVKSDENSVSANANHLPDW